ncbi:MICAL-like protein 2 [Holothuria leucospilota]|uniref:MICAL-like protein 2 n=1 Tax=Holothuria leucospilota TaxID=206669 RepID=A0A9Q1C224_HOLLE|nr:MICAL-like protein 2 [Holothuria leucospilota]
MADSSVPAGGHRSRSTVRSRKKKRCHSSSDSSSPSSVRGRSSDKQPDQSETLSQILSLLSQMSQGNKPTQAERPVQTQPQPQAERPVQIRPQLQTERPVQTQSQLQAERPVRIRQPQTERESQFQHPRSVSIQERASPSADTSVASGLARRDSLTSELSPDPDFFSDDNHEVSGSDEDDDPPLFGTDLTRESFDKAVEVVRRQLGFEDVQQPTEDQGRKSKLSLNRPTPDKRPLMPVDVECEDRLKAASTSRKWTPFPRKQTSEFRVDEREWNACFRTPPIPTGAVDHLRNAGAMDAKGRYRSAPSKKSEKALSAEVLMKSFRQDVSRRDTGAVVNILGPLSRLIFDQFARIAVRSVQERRDLLLESLSWPTQDIKRRFLDLPLEGKDIFGGRFDEHLQVEVKRRKDLKKADFRLPAAFSRRRSPDFRRSSRPSQPRSSGSSDRRPAELGIKPAVGTGRTTVKRPMEEDNPFKGKEGITPIKKAFPANTCQVCGKKVYLVEKVVSNNKLYHRSCFKCNKCGGTLRPGNAKVGVDPSQIECQHHQDKIWNLRTNMASRIKKENKENSGTIWENQAEKKAEDSSPWVTQKPTQPAVPTAVTPPSAKKPPIPKNPPSKLIHPHLSSQSSARAQFFSPSSASKVPVGEESKKTKDLEKEKAKAGLITSIAGAMAKDEEKQKVQSKDGKLYNSNSKETLIDEPAESSTSRKAVTPSPKVDDVKPSESKTNNYNSVTSVSQRISMFSQNDTNVNIKGKGPMKEERKKDDKVSEKKKDDKLSTAEKIPEETKADTKPIISGGGGVKAMINKMEEENDQVSQEQGGEGEVLTESEGDSTVKGEVSGLEIKKDLSEEEKQDTEQLEKEKERKHLEAAVDEKESGAIEDDEIDENNPFFASDDETTEAEEPQKMLSEEKMDTDEVRGDSSKVLGDNQSQEETKTGFNKTGDGRGDQEGLVMKVEEHVKDSGSELTEGDSYTIGGQEKEVGENGDNSAMEGKSSDLIQEKTGSNEEISRTKDKKSAKVEDSDLDYDDSLNPFGSDDDEQSTSDDDSDSDLGPNNPFAESDEGELDYDESLNPFGDDDDEEMLEGEPRENPFTGSPILRTSPSKSSKVKPPRPPPPKTTTPKKGVADAPKFKTRDEILQEMSRARNTLKQKKRRAPDAPTVTPSSKTTPPSSDGGSSSPSLAGTPRSRKSRRAPLPPGKGNDNIQQNGISGSPKPKDRTLLDTPEGSPVPSPRTTKSQKVRQHHVTPEEIQKEIAEIEAKTSELEKKGIELEDKLRAEMKDLEIQHAEVEYEMRVLMHKQEHLKTDEDAKKEEELLELLIALVQQRSTIVDRLEEDRIREQAEDETIRNMMQMKGLDRESVELKKEKKKKKKKKKHKEKDKEKTKEKEKHKTKNKDQGDEDKEQ